MDDPDYDTLSYSTLLVRGELLGVLNLTANPDSTTLEFTCPSEAKSLIVERRCQRVACHSPRRIDPLYMSGDFLSYLLPPAPSTLRTAGLSAVPHMELGLQDSSTYPALEPNDPIMPFCPCPVIGLSSVRISSILADPTCQRYSSTLEAVR